MKLRKFPEIDFLRFLAVLMVVMFHFTARRADILPYGSYVNGAPWSLGWAGVQLFF
jgi:peptidoglycan/LPS O-acetylase OafA/YrhL